jgi:phosphoribosyl 1,2-cyclic phosphodiesterase
MKLSVLGSGSRGNSTLVVTDQTRILIDAGMSGRDLAARLQRVGVDPAQVSAVVITHEHGDHTKGCGIFARRFGTPLYMTQGTRDACARLLRGDEAILPYRPGHRFRIGDVEIDPFLTAHDAVDPVALTLTGVACGTRIGIAMDLGRPTAGIRHSLSGCDFLVLEANHDEELLRSGPYPASVQARISSSHGHLSNRAAAAFALELLHPKLAGIILAHLSAECNRPEIARKVVSKHLRNAGWKGMVEVASQDEPTPLLDIPSLGRHLGPEQLTLI